MSQALIDAPLGTGLRILGSCWSRSHVYPEEAKTWLQAASQFDEAARSLISYYLRRAAEGVGDKPDEWRKLAVAAGLDSPETTFVEVLSVVRLRHPKQTDPIRKALLRQFQSLRALKKAARLVATELQSELALLDAKDLEESEVAALPAPDGPILTPDD